MTKRPRQVYVEDEVWEALKKLAEDDDRTISAYLSRLIMKAAEAAKANGG